MLVYFSETSATPPAGELRAVFCADANCSSWGVRALAHGASGFGRDASLAFAAPAAGAPPAMLVSFLDLQGQDSPDAMVTRLAVLGPADNGHALA